MTQSAAGNARKGEVSAVILAGGKKEDALAKSQRVAHRSLIEIGGRAIISRMVEAFREAEGIREVIVVGMAEVLEALPPGVRGIGAAGEATENLCLGLKESTSEWVAASPADMPWITSEAIAEFLASGLAVGADMVYPIIPRSVYERRFPAGRRTYVSLRDGTFTGGNMVLARKRFLEMQLPLIHRLFEYRKNPLALAGALGAGFMLRLLLRRLDLFSIEERASHLTGGRTVALPIARAELAFDIDNAEGLEAALKMADPQGDAETSV